VVGFESARCGKLDLSLVRVEPTTDSDVAVRISNLLVAVSSDLMESRGGHIPDALVRQTIHPIYASIDSVRTTFAKAGYRFVAISARGELAATVLVSREPDVVLGFSGNKPIGTTTAGAHPQGFHSIFNLAVAKVWRRRGVARAMLTEIATGHRSLFRGRGWWARSEPPDHNFYLKLGFAHETQHDGFVEGVPVASAVFPNPSAFNRAFWCACSRVRIFDPPLQQKLRYWAFTQPWPDE
jgi:GNAT superfamily N-acetyltransferase